MTEYSLRPEAFPAVLAAYVEQVGISVSKRVQHELRERSKLIGRALELAHDTTAFDEMFPPLGAQVVAPNRELYTRVHDMTLDELKAEIARLEAKAKA